MTLRNPEGTQDFLPNRAAHWERFKREAYRIFGYYGYLPIETPVFEQTELFVRGIGEATDVVGKEMFQVLSGANLEKLLHGEKIKSKSQLSLRPEGTAGTVRAVVQHDLVPQGASPVKLMYAGPMFRAERPQKGRYRQFYQVGIECLGVDAPSIDAEAIIMLMRFYESIGIPVASMRLLLNSMGCDECRPTYRTLVYTYLQEHKNELCEECMRRAELNPLRAFDCKNPACSTVMQDAPKLVDHLCPSCQDHYGTVKDYLENAAVAYEEDWRLVRGLDYYTRTVFEVQVVDGLGSQNAIGGGGRYDKLAEEIGGKATPGLGFALGYERCVLALEAAGKEVPSATHCDMYIARVDTSVQKEAFTVLQAARDAGLTVEMDHQGRSLKSQFKMADKLAVDSVLIVGPDEIMAGQIKVRTMATREETFVPLKELLAVLEKVAEHRTEENKIMLTNFLVKNGLLAK